MEHKISLDIPFEEHLKTKIALVVRERFWNRRVKTNVTYKTISAEPCLNASIDRIL
jgi:hypothetical protein